MKISIMAIISGIAGSLNRYLSGREKGFRDTLIIAIVHFFFGLLVGVIAKTFANNEYIILGCAGVGGFLGIKTMGLLIAWIESITKLKI